MQKKMLLTICVSKKQRFVHSNLWKNIVLKIQEKLVEITGSEQSHSCCPTGSQWASRRTCTLSYAVPFAVAAGVPAVDLTAVLPVGTVVPHMGYMLRRAAVMALHGVAVAVGAGREEAAAATRQSRRGLRPTNYSRDSVRRHRRRRRRVPTRDWQATRCRSTWTRGPVWRRRRLAAAVR